MMWGAMNEREMGTWPALEGMDVPETDCGDLCFSYLVCASEGAHLG